MERNVVDQIKNYEAALRWIYEHGFYKDRPDFVNQAFADAYIPVRNERFKKTQSQYLHHIDGNPYNNDPANLRIVDMKERD